MEMGDPVGEKVREPFDTTILFQDITEKLGQKLQDRECFGGVNI